MKKLITVHTQKLLEKNLRVLKKNQIIVYKCAICIKGQTLIYILLRLLRRVKKENDERLLPFLIHMCCDFPSFLFFLSVLSCVLLDDCGKNVLRVKPNCQNVTTKKTCCHERIYFISIYYRLLRIYWLYEYYKFIFFGDIICSKNIE